MGDGGGSCGGVTLNRLKLLSAGEDKVDKYSNQYGANLRLVQHIHDPGWQDPVLKQGLILTS